MIKNDFNAELHARPSIRFSGPALVEHIALLPAITEALRQENMVDMGTLPDGGAVKTQLEFHTEFATVTRVTSLTGEIDTWPCQTLSISDAQELAGLPASRLVYRADILIQDGIPADLIPFLKKFGFADTAASVVGGGAAQICSDFRVVANQSRRLVLFNGQLNAYRLGRMVRRLYEIETYRAMALLSLPEARRLSPLLIDYDRDLAEIANRNVTATSDGHKALLDEISALSARIISAAADTRTRFGATVAYTKIVEERIGELKETHVPGFQRFGVFVARRFKPAIRTCEATARRLEQMSIATMHLIDLLQTRIQMEVELQNAAQIKAVAERTAAQVKIQRAVEGFSIIAISYYLVGLLKIGTEALDNAGIYILPSTKLASIPIVIVAVSLAILNVRKALAGHQSSRG